MRLASLDAIRYGALEGECLSGLSEGLNVVLGPNESGKTTMTALARHVLYGYPDGRAKERGYAVPAGGRAARLIFADESGQWSIERVEGKNRGPVSVTTLEGPERPELLGELTAGVTEQTYRIVFGFGLDELAEIEKGDDKDIVSRLYAAGMGLGINPMDVRKHLVAQAADLFSKGAQKPQVNAYAARLREIKQQLAVLEAMATQYTGDQQQLVDLAARLEPLRSDRDALDTRIALLEQDTTRLDTAVSDGEQLARELIDVDERIVGAAPRIAAVLADESGFRAHAEAAVVAEAGADDLNRRAAQIDVPAQAVDSPENRAAVEGWRDRLAALHAKAQATEEAARQAEARAEASAEVAASVRPSAIESNSRVLPVVLAVALCAIGAAVAGLGALQQQGASFVLGAVVLIGGVAAFVLALKGRNTTDAAAPPLDAEAARVLSEAKAARLLATTESASADAGVAEWREWLVTRGLDSQGDDPQAVRALLDAAAQRQRLVADAGREAAAARRERESAEAWVVQLVDVVRIYDSAAAQIPPLSEAGALAARAKHDLEWAKRAELERSQLQQELAAAQADGRRLADRLAASRAVGSEIAERRQLSADDLLPELTIQLERAREERTESREAFDMLSKEHSALASRLDTEGREDSMARARQAFESVQVQAAQAADSYLVSTLAVRLIDRARERFERERQPEVVRTAARVFSAMTEGRYTDVRVPLDGSGISVIAANSTLKTTAELSRGTAEQLYLALRIGLIGSLGQVGRWLPVLLDDVVVNFDPKRREGAITALAELAAMRQVVFFTCHPDVATALTERVAGATLVKLDRCELRA